MLLNGIGYANPGQVTSLVAISSVFCGMLGNIAFSIILGKTKKYKLLASISNIVDIQACWAEQPA